MTTPRNQLIEFIEQGAIPTDAIDQALSVTKVSPDGKSWRTFIDHLLLWLGGLALAFAVLFFIAYNWKELGHFAKFGIVEVFMILSIGAYCKFDEHSMTGKVSLLVATIFLGVLLALFGQTYQTGADPWQLFFNWALLMLPWALIGRFSALWLVWIALINVSISLYYYTFWRFFGIVFGSESGMLWLLFSINSLALIVWQLLARYYHWLAERWAIRLLALGSGVPLTWLVFHSIFDFRGPGGLPWLVWVLWLVAMYFYYRKVKLDLFMLAGCCLSGITVIISFVAEHLLQNGDAAAFFFLACLVIGMGGGAAFWLKNIHQECFHE